MRIQEVPSLLCVGISPKMPHPSLSPVPACLRNLQAHDAYGEHDGDWQTLWLMTTVAQDLQEAPPPWSGSHARGWGCCRWPRPSVFICYLHMTSQAHGPLAVCADHGQAPQTQHTAEPSSQRTVFIDNLHYRRGYTPSTLPQRIYTIHITTENIHHLHCRREYTPST